MKYADSQLAFNLGLAAQFLEIGRPIQFVKKTCNLTLVRMARFGLIYEQTIPDPRGFDAEGNHNGHMMKTGRWIPTPGIIRSDQGVSSKTKKKNDRKQFFDSLRAQRKAIWPK